MASKAAPAITATHEPLHVLRGLFRLIKTPPFPKELQKKAAARAGIDSLAPSSSKRQRRSNASTAYLMNQYRQSAAVTSKPEQQALRKKALAYYELRRSLAERAKLYELDSGAEAVLSPKEISRRAAARAGLQLPDEPLRLD